MVIIKQYFKTFLRTKDCNNKTYGNFLVDVSCHINLPLISENRIRDAHTPEPEKIVLNTIRYNMSDTLQWLVFQTEQ